MKKSVKLISLLVVLGLLIAGYVIYGKYAAEQPDDTQTPEDTSVEMLKIDADTILKMEYSLETEKVAFEKTEDGWIWSGDAEFPLSQSYPENMASTLSSLKAIREISDGFENEADYGLDSPSLAVKFITNTEQEYVFSLGDYNTIAEGYYAKISGKNKVYFVDSVTADAFGYGMLDMIKSDKLPSVDAESITKVEYVSSSGSKYITTDSTGAEFYAKPYVFFSKDDNGKVIAVDGKAGGELMSAISKVYLGNAVAYKPDNQALEQYSLTEKTRILVSVDYKKKVENSDSNTSVNLTTNEKYSLYIGVTADEEGNTVYYAMLPESNVVYKLLGGATVAEAMKADFKSNLVCPVTTDHAVSFKCEIGGTNSVYFYNSADVEKNEKITSVINKISALTYTGTVNGIKGELVFKTTFDTGEKEYVLNVYKYDEESYVASFDVFDGLIIPQERVDDIINSLKDINK